MSIHYYSQEDATAALMEAVYRADVKTVRSLLELGAEPNQKTVRDYTPLIAATEANSPEIVRLLLGAGADPAMPGPEGYTAPAWAENHGYREITQIFKDDQAAKAAREEAMVEFKKQHARVTVQQQRFKEQAKKRPQFKII